MVLKQMKKVSKFILILVSWNSQHTSKLMRGHRPKCGWSLNVAMVLLAEKFYFSHSPSYVFHIGTFSCNFYKFKADVNMIDCYKCTWQICLCFRRSWFWSGIVNVPLFLPQIMLSVASMVFDTRVMYTKCKLWYRY